MKKIWHFIRLWRGVGECRRTLGGEPSTEHRPPQFYGSHAVDLHRAGAVRGVARCGRAGLARASAPVVAAAAARAGGCSDVPGARHTSPRHRPICAKIAQIPRTLLYAKGRSWHLNSKHADARQTKHGMNTAAFFCNFQCFALFERVWGVVCFAPLVRQRHARAANAALVSACGATHCKAPRFVVEERTCSAAQAEACTPTAPAAVFARPCLSLVYSSTPPFPP